MQGQQGSLWQSWLSGQRLGHATVAAKHVFATTQGR